MWRAVSSLEKSQQKDEKQIPRTYKQNSQFANLNYVTRMSKSAHSSIQTENQTQPPIPKRKNKIRIFANIKHHCACQTLRTTCAELYIHKPPIAMIFIRIRTQTKTAADETQVNLPMTKSYFNQTKPYKSAKLDLKWRSRQTII